MTLAAPPVLWTAALGIAALTVLGYVAAFVRRDRRARARSAEAQRLGIHRPLAQYPYIDPAICVGCGGCVAACPEGDVLGIVGGLATIVNGARCVGVGACAKACPVGAIEIAMGDYKSRADVPRMDEHNETDVRGLFIAGELGGLALIRNSVAQGRDTVRHIARRAGAQRARDPELLDLAIVGAGPSGLSAALSAVECGLRYVVLEQQEDLGGTIFHYPRRKLTHTQPVELPLYGALGKDEYSKEELLALFEELVCRHRLALRFGEKVLEIARGGEEFRLRTPAGSYRSRFVLLALGRRGTPRKLDVPGEELAKVMYQLRDAEQYRGRKILCVGGGDSAVEAALGLARQPGNEVVLSYRGEGFHRIKHKNQARLEALVKRGKIRPLLRSQVTAIEAGRVRLQAEEGELALANDFVFVLIGGEPPFDFLRRTGVRFGNEG